MRYTGTWMRRGSVIVLHDAGRAPRADGQSWETREDDEIGSGARPTLSRGARGSAVRDLQLLLRAHGFDPGSADGVFGSATDGAVRSFQRAGRLAVDGVVGPNTWRALTAPRPWAPSPQPPPAGRTPPGGDPAIDALNLSEPARGAAYTIKSRHPWVVFTSGRRDPARQAWAMAGNVVRNRQWIAQTYASNPVSTAAQAWVDGHPEARTQQAIADGLTSVFARFSARDLGRLSYHLSGLAFDIQPVPAEEGAITATIRGLPGVKEFLTREGGLTIWHVAF